ncbi:MAG: ubiquinol-cytochrome c reductase iron-sulfur subunit [Actinomycetota bacterium]|nr:ubiquinol-cytochrome c reductase iron-sulfur subunit [Actinomycetota bacterium]
MSEMDRRSFLSTAWKAGFGLLAVAGVVTAWDFIKPPLAAGFAAVVSTVTPDAVPTEGVLEVREARGYLVNVEGDVLAFSEVCTHLGCRVPFVDENNRFECPCHGSKFTREGDYLEGPAPRGMDEYATEVVDGVIEIDTTDVTQGPTPGSERT